MRNSRCRGRDSATSGSHFKTHFINISRPPHIGLGVMASLYFPTPGGSDNNWIGSTSTGGEVIGILDKEFLAQGRFRVALNGGIRFNSGTTYTDNDTMTGGPMRTGLSITTGGNEIPFGLGLAYAIAVQKFDVVGEVYGVKPLGTYVDYQPLEAIAGVKLYLARNSFLSLGGGTGLDHGQGANPDLRAFISIVFEPNIGDRDGDGIKDDVDKCPDEPEDFDGFEDADGCRIPTTITTAFPTSTTSARTFRARHQTAARSTRRTIATATASPTTSTSARTIRKTSTASRTRTAARIPTTIRTASRTSTTCARTIPRTRMASRTPTAARIPTTTRTASSTRTTSVRTSRRLTTASRTPTAARIAVASS